MVTDIQHYDAQENLPTEITKGKTKDSSEVHCFLACTLKATLSSITDVSTDSKIKIEYKI